MEIGKEYAVKSRRKGNFSGRLKSADDTWATFEITSGKTEAMLSYNEAFPGDEVTVRRAWFEFKELQKAA